MTADSTLFASIMLVACSSINIYLFQGVRKLFGSGAKSKEEESETLGLPDLMAAMERDYRYAKSELLYRLRNKPLPN